MYFPILRGKQYELQALEELSTFIKDKRNVCPFIEPVNTNSLSKRILKNLDRDEVPFILALNPCVGEMTGCCEEIETELIDMFESTDTTMLGYFLSEETTVEEVKSILDRYNNFSFALYHIEESENVDEIIKLAKKNNSIRYHLFHKKNTGKKYRKNFSELNRVIIEDPFLSAEKNALYPKMNDFSDLAFEFSSEYFGFGDFQIVGEPYSESGGPATAVALHLTEEDMDDEEVTVRHFVSNDTDGRKNVQKKYFQALEKLCSHVVDLRGEPWTLGEIGFAENLKDKKYHGLGFPKKLSIMHHIELMSEIIKEN